MNRQERQKQSKIRRKRAIRSKISGTTERPRLVIFRSNRHISAQIINDVTGETLVSAASFSKDMKSSTSNMKKGELSEVIGESIAKRALERDITQVAFDRNGYLYHGRVKAFAEAARKFGLNF